MQQQGPGPSLTSLYKHCEICLLEHTARSEVQLLRIESNSLQGLASVLPMHPNFLQM